MDPDATVGPRPERQSNPDSRLADGHYEGKVVDPLTHLPNRLYFIDRLESAIEAVTRFGDTATECPNIATAFVTHTVFTHKLRGMSVAMCGNRSADPLIVSGVNFDQPSLSE